MSVSLLQFLFEMTICLASFLLLYRLSVKGTVTALGILLSSIWISVILPLLQLSDKALIDLLMPAALEAISGQLPLAVTYSANVVVAVSDVLAFFWLVGFVWISFERVDTWTRTNEIIKEVNASHEGGFSLVFKVLCFSAFYFRGTKMSAFDFPLALKASSSTSFHRFIVLLTELLAAVFWFHPLVFWLRREFAKESRFFAMYCETPKFSKQNQTVKSLFKTAFVPLLAFFLMLFGFDYAKKLPLAEEFARTEEILSSSLHEPFFDYEKSLKGTVLDWGEIDLLVQSIDAPNSVALEYSVAILNRPFFKKIKDAELKFYKEGERQRIVDLEALFYSPNFEKPLLAIGRDEFSKYANVFSSQREVSIFIKLETEAGESWHAAIGVTRYNRFYRDHPLVQEFLETNPDFRYVLDTENPFFEVETGSDGVEEEDAVYTVKWGEIEILLEKYANPNVYQGDLYLDLETFEQRAGTALEILKNGNSQEIIKFGVNRFDSAESENNPLWRQVEKEIRGKYSVDIDSLLVQGCSPGTRFRISLETESIRIASAWIHIIDPYEIYFSDFRAKKIDDAPADFFFQVINLPGRKTMLKADTTLSDNKKVLDIYSDPSRYKIIHLPDFKTNRRLIAADDFLWWDEDAEKSENQSVIFQLPEYVDYVGKATGLWWGDLFANTNSVNLTRAELKKNSKSPLVLRVGEQELKIVECEMVLKHGDAEPLVYVLKRDKGELRMPDFSEIITETSVGVQKIVVKDKEQFYYFPANFAFHIGKELTEYELVVDEVAAGGELSDSLIVKEGAYEFWWKNTDLKSLISDVTGFNDNKIRMQGDVKNPTLNVRFFSKKINTQTGIALLMSELRKRYKFSYTDKFETLASYRLGLVSERKLNNYIVAETEVPKSASKFIQQGGYDVLAVARPFHLAEYLERRFNQHIYPVVNTGQAYYFSISTGDFEAVRQQLLDDYGLQVVSGNFPVRFIDVSFLKEEDKRGEE